MSIIKTMTMNPAIDASMEVDHVTPERKLRCSRPQFDPGGGGVNVSRVVTRLGGETVSFFPSGGRHGQHLEDLLKKEDCRTQSTGITGMTRENYVVYESSTEQQYRFGTPGPEFEDAEWQQCLDEFFQDLDEVKFIVASGSLPPGVPEDFYGRMAERAREKEIKMILDTSGPALGKTLEQGVYLIKPNLRELEDLTGQEYQDESQQEELAMKLVREGKSQVVVVSLGAGGALVVSAEGTTRMRAPTVPIRSKVGAGDSMVAGIAFGLSRDMDVFEAAMYGLAAGSAAVMTPGTELCRKEDVQRLFADLKRKANEGDGPS